MNNIINNNIYNDIYDQILIKSNLFYNITPDNIHSMIKCLDARIMDYKKGELILRAGQCTNNIGIVLDGTIHITREDYWGNVTLINKYSSSDMFGEIYAIKGDLPSEVNVYAMTDCRIMFLNVGRILRTCSSSCTHHQALIANLMMSLTEKNYMLNKKIEYMSKRSTREKLLSYLSTQASSTSDSTFTIPFNRQQLADFLCVDRSAMTVELSKLKKEGIIDFNKNTFKIL